MPPQPPPVSCPPPAGRGGAVVALLLLSLLGLAAGLASLVLDVGFEDAAALLGRDAFEPNDAGPAAARPLGPGRRDGLVAQGGDVDWFAVDVPASKHLVVRAAPPPRGRAGLTLHDARTGVTLATAERTAFEERVALLGQGGPVAVRVHGERGPYALEVVLEEAGTRLEPNDDPASASPLAPGRLDRLRCDGEDWFRLRLAPERRVVVTAAGAPSGLQLELLDGRGQPRARGRARGRDVVLEHVTGRGDGDPGALLRVHGALGAYDLALASDAAEDRFEPNDARGQARALAPGVYDGLHADGEDWYAVELARGGDLLGVEVTPAELEVDLLDPDARELARGEPAGAVRSAGFLATAPGAVLVRVRGRAPGYRLVVSTDPGDAFEPNDDPLAAADLAPGTHEGLVCTGEDYYRVAVPAVHGLAVQVLGGGQGLGLEVFEEETGAALQAGPGSQGRPGGAGAPLVASRPPARAEGSALVRVHGPRVRYTLVVVLVPPGPFEPNDAREEARALAPGRHDVLRTSGDDWFRVDLAAACTVSVDATYDPQLGPLSLELHDAAGALVAGSGGRTGRERVQRVHELGGAPAALFVRVRTASGRDYQLGVDVAGAAGPGRPATGGRTSGQAVPLRPGTYPRLRVEGNAWFRVAVRDGETVSADVRFDGEVAALRLSLHDEQGALLERGQGTEHAQHAHHTWRGGPERPTGEVLVRVYNAASDFALVLVVEAPEEPPPVIVPAGEDPFEPNDERARAAHVGPGTLAGLPCDGEDWYRVEVPGGHRLRARLRFRHEEGDLDLEVQDEGGAVLAASRGTRSGEEALVQGGGPRFVRVYAQGGRGGPPDSPGEPPYDLILSLHREGPLQGQGTAAAATRLEPGRHGGLLCAGHDWYRVDVPAGARLTVTARFEHGEGDLDLALTDAAGAVVLDSSTGTGDEERVTLACPAARTLLVHVDHAINVYELEVEVTQGRAAR